MKKLKTYFKLLTVFFDFLTFKNIRKLIFAMYVVKYRKYYTHIDYLPIFNFAEIMKGNLNYLYENKKDRKYPELFFKRVFEQMYFQFPELNNEELREKALLAVFENNIVIAKNKTEKSRWINESNTLKAKINESKKDIKKFDLNEFTNFIEHMLEHPVGSLDVHKVSTSKAYSNYNIAMKKFDNLKKKNAINKTK